MDLRAVVDSRLALLTLEREEGVRGVEEAVVFDVASHLAHTLLLLLRGDIPRPDGSRRLILEAALRGELHMFLRCSRRASRASRFRCFSFCLSCLMCDSVQSTSSRVSTVPTIGRLMRCRGGCGRGDIPLSNVGGCETLSDITALTLGPCRPMRPEGQVTPSVLAGGMLRSAVLEERRSRERRRETENRGEICGTCLA